jgi:DNA-binding CsgD family transcriptional regulator
MTDERPLSTEELLQAMERDEAEGATKLSPREYGLMRGIKPQLVYYYIKRGKVKLEHCICGRNVIDVEAADAFFKPKEGTEETT